VKAERPFKPVAATLPPACMNLDKTDLKILDILSENGRISYVDLAKMLNLSRVAVRERINHIY
jgi:DNA-binding Lrp family transcriptional regulator